MKHLLYELKQPFLKSDMRRFLFEGFLASIVFGGFIGAFEFILANYFNSILANVAFLILFYFLSDRLYRSFSQYHIWYSILAVFFLLFSKYIMGLTSFLLVVQIITGNASVVFSDFWSAVLVLNPLLYFQFLWFWILDFEVIINNLLQLLFTIYFSYLIYQRMKR
ncbi:MAG: hypothetical protein RBS87_04235 [Acholeplasma sp.]|jgi:hypothetical protein|nr:hypothetical protein [Acholeplasma sp.]